MTPADEAFLASWFARPGYSRLRELLEEIAPGAAAKIDRIVWTTRRSLWRDFSEPAE